MQRHAAAGNWMVGPPSSRSLRDQEDSSWRADSRTVRTSRLSFSANSHLPSSASSHFAGYPVTTAIRGRTIGLPCYRLRFGGEMLFKIAIALLAAWVIGVLGVYRVGDLVHVLLLGGLMLLLLAFLRARDAVARRVVGPSDKP